MWPQTSSSLPFITGVGVPTLAVQSLPVVPPELLVSDATAYSSSHPSQYANASHFLRHVPNASSPCATFIPVPASTSVSTYSSTGENNCLSLLFAIQHVCYRQPRSCLMSWHLFACCSPCASSSYSDCCNYCLQYTNIQSTHSVVHDCNLRYIACYCTCTASAACCVTHDSVFCCGVGAPMLGCWQSKPLASPPLNHTTIPASTWTADQATASASLTLLDIQEATPITDISDETASQASLKSEIDATAAPRQTGKLVFLMNDLMNMSERGLMAILETLTEDRNNTHSRMEIFGAVVHLLQLQHRLSF